MEKEEGRRELERKMEIVQDEIAKEKKLQQVRLQQNLSNLTMSLRWRPWRARQLAG